MAKKKMRNGLFAVLVAAAIMVLGMGTMRATAVTGTDTGLAQSTEYVGYYPATPVE